MGKQGGNGDQRTSVYFVCKEADIEIYFQKSRFSIVYNDMENPDYTEFHTTFAGKFAPLMAHYAARREYALEFLEFESDQLDHETVEAAPLAVKAPHSDILSQRSERGPAETLGRRAPDLG